LTYPAIFFIDMVDAVSRPSEAWEGSVTKWN
jgi:hypothetical protein